MDLNLRMLVHLLQRGDVFFVEEVSQVDGKF